MCQMPQIAPPEVVTVNHIQQSPMKAIIHQSPMKAIQFVE